MYALIKCTCNSSQSNILNSVVFYCIRAPVGFFCLCAPPTAEDKQVVMPYKCTERELLKDMRFENSTEVRHFKCRDAMSLAAKHLK